MRHGSLFSGIGGFDYAAEQVGWENVFHCEINPFCRTILNYYWPYAKSYTDIFEFDARQWRGKVDIITAGFPCQPFSNAGKRKGSTDNRFIWPENLRIIKEVQPPFVLAENVPGLLTIERGVVFEQVCVDLENEGYEVTPFIIPAVAKDAVHRRDRVWIVAYCNRYGQRYINGLGQDTGSQGTSEIEGLQRERVWGEFGGENTITTNTRLQCVADVTYNSKQGLPQPGQTRVRELSKEGEGGLYGRFKQCDRNATNGSSKRLEGYREHGERAGERAGERIIGEKTEQETWIEAATRLCRVDDGTTGRLDTTTFSKSKWRQESLKAYGNAIYWPVAYEIFKAIETSNQ